MYCVVSEIFYKWYDQCTIANVFPDEPILQEEALVISKWPEKETLTDLQLRIDG